jgi:hypothetical protein
LWAGFCRLLVPYLAESALDSLENFATSKLHHSDRPLTPDERVSHLLCDSDVSVQQQIGNFCGLAVFGLLLTLPAWQEANNDVFRPVLWCLRLFSPVITVGCFIATIRFIWRAVHRHHIQAKLEAERKRWDPLQGNLRIFVSRRDREPIARILFDAITVRCYRSHLTVLQYTDFSWPSYHMRESRVNKDLTWEGEPNPGVVRKASLLVWLDIGETSDAMKLELAVARKWLRPVVRIHRVTGAADNFAVTAPSASGHIASLETVPDVTVEVLEAVLRDARNQG